MKNESDKKTDDIELDIESEIDDSVIAEESLNEVVKKLREKLKKCGEEKLDYLTQLQRTKADFINLRKRDEDDKKDFAKFANQELIMEILPVLDSFEHAILASKKENPDASQEGLIKIQLQLLSTLEKVGLKKIYPLNEQFDPKYHEAIKTIETENNKEDNIVLVVLQTGYKLGEKVIRTARVAVGDYKSKS